jgi:hypothetical protein
MTATRTSLFAPRCAAQAGEVAAAKEEARKLRRVVVDVFMAAWNTPGVERDFIS